MRAVLSCPCPAVLGLGLQPQPQPLCCRAAQRCVRYDRNGVREGDGDPKELFFLFLLLWPPAACAAFQEGPLFYVSLLSALVHFGFGCMGTTPATGLAPGPQSSRLPLLVQLHALLECLEALAQHHCSLSANRMTFPFPSPRVL